MPGVDAFINMCLPRQRASFTTVAFVLEKHIDVVTSTIPADQDKSLSNVHVRSKVTSDMNERLCKDFTEEEIGTAMFRIGPLKAPGLDCFPAHFYHRNWGILKDDVVRAVQSFFRRSVLPEGINDKTIVLIPKIENLVE
ncbi:uncharacterized protein LOC127784202 isoform X2 [Oryza glaberrima]|uniref:uncharacterized protein LOC127784202 isoform X2 n=1 Tax=Oryza glaberrima TaxID=4538 RepID=UPI00224C4C9D|nr:uncharacterized protein LOC127784202 isoform X2 [Oryza glaberrima]